MKTKLCSFILSILLFFAGLSGTAQLYINNGQLTINPGATVTVKGDITSNVDITGGGKVLLNGTNPQNVNMNGFAIPNLEIDNGSNVALTGNAIITDDLLLTNGLLRIGNNNLTIIDTATISGGSSGKFIVTDGSGYVKKNKLSTLPFFLPIGFSATEYNPLTVSNSGVIDNYTFRTTGNVLVDGVTPATTGFANSPWIVGEDVAGGSNLSITASWAAADELAGFNRSKTGLARYVSGTNWDLLASNVIAASGTGPYSRTRSGITSLGTFAIADLQLVNRANVSLKAFLQGAYTGSGGGIAAGLMRDQLRANAAIPFTQPYSTGKFVQQGVQGGSETVVASVFNAAPITDNNIVDWVYVTLLDAASPTTKLQTRAALIQRDGDIVDLDGVSPLSFPIDSNGAYHISVGHRNHLSVRTPNASPLMLAKNGATATWDFTAAADRAYADPLISSNTPLIPVTFSGVTKYCLRGGNTDGMTNAGANGRTIIYSGSGNDKSSILSTGLGGNSSSSLTITAANYLTMGMFDLNLNGTVIYSGSGNDPIIILNALNGNTSSTAKEHL